VSSANLDIFDNPTILSPNGGESIGGNTLTIRWQEVLPPRGVFRFAAIGDYGAATVGAGPAAAEESVADRLISFDPNFIITLGDNNYEDGSSNTIDDNVGQFFSDYIGNYQGQYGGGALENRFFPSPGNHDWGLGNLNGYLNYFTLPGRGTNSSGNERYYRYSWGNVDFFVIDSDSNESDGNTPSSTQGQWLKTGLTGSNATFKIVYFHHAPYGSDTSHAIGENSNMRWPFKNWGADLVLAGHLHLYERTVINGLTYITCGSGGRSLRLGGALDIGSQIRYSQDYGFMLVDVSSTEMQVRFINKDGDMIDKTVIKAKDVSTTVSARSYQTPVWYEIFFTDSYDDRKRPEWVQIASVPGGNDEFLWEIPRSVKGKKCKFGVRARDQYGVRSEMSVSAGTFTIRQKELQKPSALTPEQGIPYRSFVPITLNHAAILNTHSQRSFYSLYYSSSTYDIDWTVIQENVPVGSPPILWDIRDLEAGKYDIKIILQDDDGNASIPTIVTDVTVCPINNFVLDTLPPRGTIEIRDNTEFTKERSVIVELSAFDEATDIKSVSLRDRTESTDDTDGETSTGSPEVFATVKTWQIRTSADGVKFVEALFTDFGENNIVDEEGDFFFRTYLRYNGEEVTAFLTFEEEGNTDRYTGFGGDTPVVFQDKSQIATLTGEPTSFAIFSSVLYAGIKQGENKGNLSKIDGGVVTSVHDFTDFDTVINAMVQFGSSLYIGLQNGEMYAFNGSTVSLVSDLDRQIIDMTVNGNVLLITLEHETDVTVYDGTTFTTTEWTDGGIQV